MRDKSAAFSNATEALSKLGVPENLPALHSAGIHIKRSILGGSHSVVTYPPLNALQSRKRPGEPYPMNFGSHANLYVHIAFCETMCTFCHYAVKNYRGKAHSPPSRTEVVERYLKALKVEIKWWGDQLSYTGTEISSIYIGGGTPLVLEAEQLVDLLNTIRARFRVRPGAEICVEGSPLTITAEGGAEKLRILRENGVTRFSFGVQSFDDEVLKRAARGYRKETAIEACKIVDSVFGHWNVDLIQSLYKGRLDEVWENLQVLREVRPPHITYYHARFANRPQGAWYNDSEKQLNFEGEQETLLGRMLIWEELKAMGYEQVDGNRFVRDERFVDPFKKSRTSVTSNLLGLGASAYSHVDSRFRSLVSEPQGVFFRNVVDIDEYMQRMEKRKGAVGSELRLRWTEYLAASFVISLRTGRRDADEWRFSDKAVVKHYQALLRDFAALGLLEEFDAGGIPGCPETGWRLSPLGQLFEDEVLSSFYSPHVQELLKAA